MFSLSVLSVFSLFTPSNWHVLSACFLSRMFSLRVLSTCFLCVFSLSHVSSDALAQGLDAAGTDVTIKMSPDQTQKLKAMTLPAHFTLLGGKVSNPSEVTSSAGDLQIASQETPEEAKAAREKASVVVGTPAQQRSPARKPGSANDLSPRVEAVEKKCLRHDVSFTHFEDRLAKVEAEMKEFLKAKDK